MAKSDTKLVKTHQLLMEAYREALRQSDGLKTMDRAFVHHVVTVSSRESAGYLRTRFPDAEALAKEAFEFSQALAPNDAVAGVISFGQAQAKANAKAILAILFGGTLVVALAAIGRALGGVVGVIGLPTLILSIFAVLDTGGGSELLNALSGPAAARAVLTKTLDQPEKQLFALTNASPPTRPAFVVAGVIKVAFIIVGFILLLFVCSLLR